MRTNSARLMPMLFVLALCGCATPVPPASFPVEIAPPILPPPPADVMVERPANFLERLRNFFLTSPPTPTK